MLLSVEGFWMTAQVNTGEFLKGYLHTFDGPGHNVYATISLSGLDHFATDMPRRASAYIAWWTEYGADGKLFPPYPNSMGRAQNAVFVRNCGSLYFRLDVANWVVATAQINIFQFRVVSRVLGRSALTALERAGARPR